MLAVIGDVHGHIDTLRRTLATEELIDPAGQWSGGARTLWFLGDYCDRGPDGIGVMEMIMRLQVEATVAGGSVGALLGNHDILLLAAREWGDTPDGSRPGSFVASWRANGGEPEDLRRLEPRHVTWLKALPAMAIVDNHLLAHADATFYRNYGKNPAQVNEAIGAVLQSNAPGAWDTLLAYFSQRRAFTDRFLGRERAARFLRTFGGERLVHGHTPVAKLTGKPAAEVTAAFVYAGGLCVDVDPGLYLGGPGFVAHLNGV